MNDIKDMIDRMEPDDAMGIITAAVKKLFPYISEKAKLDFFNAFTGEADRDSVPGLVHL